MKIGIVTIVNGASFGNRLQNYATQKVLENNGYTVETIGLTKKVPYPLLSKTLFIHYLSLYRISKSQKVSGKECIHFINGTSSI